MRIAVTGGRTYAKREVVFQALDRVHERHPDMILVHGGAPGADAIAAWWALAREVEQDRHPAEWKTHGRGAGPIRNQEMVDSGLDGLVAFPGGNGTADMTRRCEAAGVRVWRIDQGEDDGRRREEGGGGPGEAPDEAPRG